MAEARLRLAVLIGGVKVQTKLGEEPVGVTLAKQQSRAGRQFSRSSSWVIWKVDIWRVLMSSKRAIAPRASSSVLKSMPGV